VADGFHWLGIRRLDRWVSMSNDKRDALEAQGIEVVEQLAIPDRLVPLDAAVEIAAKKAAGYFAPSGMPGPAELHRTKGRALDDWGGSERRGGTAERGCRTRPLCDRVGSGLSRR